MYRTITVAATFTAELVWEELATQLSSRGISTVLKRVPYGQVIEALCYADGDLQSPAQDAIVCLIRIEDLVRDDSSGTVDYRDDRIAQGEAWLETLLGCLPSVGERVPGRIILSISPASRQSRVSNAIEAWVTNARERILAAVEHIADVELVDLDREADHLESHDPYLDVVAHIPFRPSALREYGCILARHLNALWQLPIKVLAVDCDDTLWGGSCAELGPTEIDLSPPYQALQQWLIDQVGAGRLVCLVSHNERGDILGVFDCSRTLLRREHLAADRIGWLPKSTLLRQLAADLSLSLDSFMLIDDNPLERSLVSEELPEVTVIELSDDPAKRLQQLSECWRLDLGDLTETDRKRTLLYQAEARRKELSTHIKSHAEFIRDLNVETDIQKISANGADRAAEIACRTNQFNTCARRHTRSDLLQFEERSGCDVWMVHVSDRIGDYGYVGLVLTERRHDLLLVSAFMLSCRVLGRGVEDSVLRHLHQYAGACGCNAVELRVERTVRNIPAQDFAKRLGGDVRETSDTMFRVIIPVKAEEYGT